MLAAFRETDVFLLGVAILVYLIAWGFYCRAFRESQQRAGQWATGLTWAAFLLQAASFVLRGYRAGHLPIFNAYEFSTTFAGGIVLVHLIFERLSRRRDLGVLILPVALALLFYASTLSKSVEPLIPIFKSLWLKIHILTAFVAYSSFAATFGASCLYLVRARSDTAQPGARIPSGLARLDNIAYQAATVGFSFLTVCVISGAIWAEYVWGRFWSWDPKETWSLITWFIFAAYLHTRYHRGWRERRAAVLGIVGFILVLITFIGVEFLDPQQHNFLLLQKQ
jgi:cytochrome c-type biogenesis protein CcsB